MAALRAAIKGPELVQARGLYLYVVYQDGIGPSKLEAYGKEILALFSDESVP